MRKIRLSPFVYKIKGSKNYALYDLLNRRLFHIIPEGDVEELIAFLIEKKLVIDNECVIPFKYQNDISDYKKSFIIRCLQIRVNGKCNDDCQECGNPCLCFKGGEDISIPIIESLLQQLKYIKVNEVIITGGNPVLVPNILKMIKEGISAQCFNILTRSNIECEEIKRLSEMGFKVVTSHKITSKISEKSFEVDSFSFFFNQTSNPCLGNVIAVDSDGLIKPCLWSMDTIGNIRETTIKELIISGKFDKYWNLSKDKIEICSDCEFRYACSDCRVMAINLSGSLTAKTSGCSYNPNVSD